MNYVLIIPVCYGIKEGVWPYNRIEIKRIKRRAGIYDLSGVEFCRIGIIGINPEIDGEGALAEISDLCVVNIVIF